MEMETKAQSIAQFLAFSKSRLTTYSFLTRLYEKEVTVDLLKEITSEKSPLLQVEGLEDMSKGELREGLEVLSGYLQSLAGRNLDDVKTELDVEYADLFLGMKKKPAHPSESAYVSGERLVMQKARDDVLAEYRKAGVDKVKEFTEPEDHIALELQFMAYLIRRTIEAIEGDEKSEARENLVLQKDFIDNHLAKWVPQLTREMQESAEVDFYKGIAKITNGFIEMEATTLGDMIAAIERL